MYKLSLCIGKGKKMKPDKAIEELRAVRHEMSAEHGHDTRSLVQHYRDMEKRYAKRMFRDPGQPASGKEPKSA